MAAQPILVKPDFRSMDLCKKRFYSADFSSADLSHLKMQGSLFLNCNFNDSDMTETDCTGAEFTSSSFINTICYRTNFKDAKLGSTVFQPKDCMGMTITLACGTLTGAKVSPLWLMGWLMFMTMMKPIGTTEPIIDNVISVIGAERYVKLKGLFSKRDF